MDKDDDAYFDWIDYTIFSGMLAVSALIGIYFAFFAEQKQDNPKEYLMGSKTIGVFPIGMSLIASNISGISLMGYPSEIFTYGTQITLVIVAEPLAYLFGAYMILPVLYNLEITSSYEYLEKRFNPSMRKLGSILFLIGNILYIPIVIYVPALAFAQISGISLTILIPLVCAVCTFYTTLGGLKAVVWTDTFQTVIMLVGVITVAIVGTLNAGGFSEVMKRNQATGRLEFFNMDYDVTIRHSFWTVFIGKFFGNLSVCAINQSMVQRYLALPTIKKARIGILMQAVGVIIIASTCCYTGLVIFSAFFDCDPLSVGYVRKADGIVPYFVMKFTRHIPALPGIFMAGVFSAALSSLSTCQNSMCGILFEDFIRPHLREDLSEKTASFYMKIIVVITGVITTILASIVDKLGGVVQTSSSLSGITLGPLLGIYFLGIFMPWINSKGALVGGISASVVVGWISVGAQYAIGRKQMSFPWKPFTVEGCDDTDMALYLTQLNITAHLPPSLSPGEPFSLYTLSYLYYTPLGILITMVVGFLVSWMTGFQDVSQMDGKLLSPIMRKYFNTKDKIEQRIRYDMQEAKSLLVH